MSRPHDSNPAFIKIQTPAISSLFKFLIPQRSTQQEEMGDSLPYTDEVLIARCKQEYELSAQLGGQKAIDACFR
jgi:hypothetical protein